MRGNGADYSHSHTRVRQIDTRVGGAGILGTRIKTPSHHGVTVPRVPKMPKQKGMQMPFKAPTRKSLTIMGPQGPKGQPGDPGQRGNRGKKGRDGKEGKGTAGMVARALQDPRDLAVLKGV